MRSFALLLLTVGIGTGTLLIFGPKPDRQELVLRGAKAQLANPAIYTTGYFKLKYPNGDLPTDQGVCTDVVIRAMRNAGMDLQSLIREDMRKRFSTYPRREAKPDPNIDHRRVPNQIHWMKKYAMAIPLDPQPKHWRAGDIVYWKLPNGLDHCGIVSDRLNSKGLPDVIHNIWQTAEEDVLVPYKVVAHFRLLPQP